VIVHQSRNNNSKVSKMAFTRSKKGYLTTERAGNQWVGRMTKGKGLIIKWYLHKAINRPNARAGNRLTFHQK